MTLLRLHAFRPEQPAALKVTAAPAAQAVSATAKPPHRLMTASVESAESVVAAPLPTAAPSVSAEPRPGTLPEHMADAPSPPPPDMAGAAPAQTHPAPAVTPQPLLAATSALAGAATGDERRAAHPASDWHGLCEAMQLGGMVRNLALHCELVSLGEEAVRLRLPPDQQFLQQQQGRLEAALQKHFGRSLKLVIDVAQTTSTTPVERKREVARERQSQATEAIHNDPFVRDVLDMFDARIEPDSIKPLET
jgi:DNA polymerase-3 subunit gamma/tau